MEKHEKLANDNIYINLENGILFSLSVVLQQTLYPDQYILIYLQAYIEIFAKTENFINDRNFIFNEF